MKTVKEVAELTGISIRTLRYYDEIGLLKPTQITESSYRLYDNKAIEKLQQIMFFRELEIPLVDIKEIMDNPDYNKEQVLATKKTLLENKRNRLNGIIELISDTMKGVNTMNFEAFNDNDVNSILDHMKKNLSEEEFANIVNQYGEGSIDTYRSSLANSLKDEKINSELIKWFGSKDKAMVAFSEPVPDLSQYQQENKEIYNKFHLLGDIEDINIENSLIERLAICYKGMFHLDNARAMLLDLANEYIQNEQLREANDSVHGKGNSLLVAKAIKRYYGV